MVLRMPVGFVWSSETSSNAIHTRMVCGRSRHFEMHKRIFKTEFKMEFYISELQPNIYIPIARYRTANNRL